MLIPRIPDLRHTFWWRFFRKMCLKLELGGWRYKNQILCKILLFCVMSLDDVFPYCIFLLQKAYLYIKMDQKDREFRLKKGNITLNSFLVVLTSPRLISCTSKKTKKKDGPFSTDVLQLEGWCYKDHGQGYIKWKI